MRKRDELSDPNSCLNRAMPNEPLFVLLGRDVAAVPTVRFWIAERIKLGRNKLDDEQILEALRWCDEVLDDQVTEPIGDEHCE